MRREEWHVHVGSDPQVAFDSLDLALQHLAGLPEQPAVIRRCIITDHLVFGFPGATPWPAPRQNPIPTTDEPVAYTKKLPAPAQQAQGTSS